MTKQTSRAAFAALALLMGAAPAIAQEQGPPAGEHPEAENSGQDPTRPVARFDTRVQYADLPGGFERETLTLRVDKPFVLGGGWKLNTRLDVPLSLGNTPGPDNPPGSADFGLDDVLIQALLIKPLDQRWAVAVGSQIILPTGVPEQFSSGKWQLVPSIALVAQVPEISRGSFAGLLIRDTFSFAGLDRFDDINVVSIQPIVNVQLPQRWFVTFSPEIELDTRDDWKAFVPFDFTVGKKVTDRIVVSLQTDIALIDTSQSYDWKTELRVGFFF